MPFDTLGSLIPKVTTGQIPVAHTQRLSDVLYNPINVQILTFRAFHTNCVKKNIQWNQLGLILKYLFFSYNLYLEIFSPLINTSLSETADADLLSLLPFYQYLKDKRGNHSG